MGWNLDDTLAAICDAAGLARDYAHVGNYLAAMKQVKLIGILIADAQAHLGDKAEHTPG